MGCWMRCIVMGWLVLGTLAGCASPNGTDIRLFTGRRVELGYRADRSAYRRITFDRCERPDQIKLGAPTQQLLELAVMLPDGSVERADPPTLRRVERDEVQIRIFDDRVEYVPHDTPMPDVPLFGSTATAGARATAPLTAPGAPPCPARP